MRARRRVLVSSILVLVASCGSAGSGVGGDVGQTLPDVDVAALDGGATMRLSDIDGPAVVNLWATWCAPCRAEIPDFEEVHRARGDEVRFVGVNVGQDAATAAEFIDDLGATYDQLLDTDSEVATELRATSMPLTVVIDAAGVVTTRHLGPLDQNGLDEAIDLALASSPSSTSTSG